MEDVSLMYFNFNLFLVPTAGGLQWDQFLECGKSGLRHHKRIAWDATPSWHHQDHHFVARTAAAGIDSDFQSRELELKTFTPIIQQCFQSCIHTAYILTYYSNILHGPLESLAQWFPKHRCFVPQKNSKIFFLPTAAKKTLVCSFSPARFCRNCLSPWQQRWWTLAHLRGGTWIKNGDFFSLFTYFFLRKTVMQVWLLLLTKVTMVILGNSRIPASSGIVEHQNDGSIDRLLPRFRRLTNHSPSFHFAKKQRHSCDKGEHSKDMHKQTCRDNPFAQGGAWRHFIKAGRWVVGELGLDMGHLNQRIFERQGRWIMRLRGAICFKKVFQLVRQNMFC